MTQDYLLKWLENPADSSQEDQAAIMRLIQEYPASAIVHLTQAKISWHLGKADKEQQLKHVGYFVPDKHKILSHFTNIATAKSRAKPSDKQLQTPQAIATPSLSASTNGPVPVTTPSADSVDATIAALMHELKAAQAAHQQFLDIMKAGPLVMADIDTGEAVALQPVILEQQSTERKESFGAVIEENREWEPISALQFYEDAAQETEAETIVKPSPSDQSIDEVLLTPLEFFDQHSYWDGGSTSSASDLIEDDFQHLIVGSRDEVNVQTEFFASIKDLHPNESIHIHSEQSGEDGRLVWGEVDDEFISVDDFNRLSHLTPDSLASEPDTPNAYLEEMEMATTEYAHSQQHGIWDSSEQIKDLELKSKIESQLPTTLSLSDAPPVDQDAIIDSFLVTRPTIKQVTSSIETTDNTAEDLSASSSLLSQQTASETLAQLFIRQGKVEKAVEIYTRLILKNPEKTAYFTAQIQELLLNGK